MAINTKGLFMTPQELQSNALRTLQERQAAISGMGGSMDALLGQVAAGGEVAGGMMAQGLKNVFGIKTAEERAAEKTQARLKEASTDYHGLMALGQEFMKEGNMREAYAVMQMAEPLKPEKTDPLKPQSQYGKIAVDEGLAVGTPDYVARVRQLYADDNAEGGVDIKDTNDIKNIFAHAKFKFGCDARDPECFRKAEASYKELKRDDQIEVLGYKTAEAAREKAMASANAVRTANSALRILDSGEVNIGSFPATRQGLDKFIATFLPSFGSTAGERASRTALLLSQTKTLAGELLSSGMFGEGTGISQRDLQTAEEIAGAADTLTPESMKEILELNAKMNAAKIMRFNQRVDNYSPDFFARTVYGSPDSFKVMIEPLYETKNVGVKPSVETVPYYDPDSDMMFDIPKLAKKALGSDGKTYYIFEGKTYSLDGTPVDAEIN